LNCESQSVTSFASVTEERGEGSSLRSQGGIPYVTSHQLLRMVSFGQVLTIATVLPIDELRLTEPLPDTIEPLIRRMRLSNMLGLNQWESRLTIEGLNDDALLNFEAKKASETSLLGRASSPYLHSFSLIRAQTRAT
jgi:hypothetical protein